MKQLDINLALNVERQLGDAATVIALEQTLNLEEKNLLAATVAMMFKEYTTAEVSIQNITF